MSDTLTVPVESVPEVVPVAEPAAPPRTREEAKQYYRSLATREAAPVPDTPARSVESTTEAPVVDGTATQSRDPATGRFTSPTETPAAPAPEVEAAPVAAPNGVPDGHVRIEIPEALQRNFGREQIVPKEQEEFIRWNINNAKARQELEALKAEAESFRRQSEEARREAEELRREKIRQDASTSVKEKWQQTPEYKAAAERYSAIAEAVGQDAAETFWAGEEAKLRALVDGEYQARVTEAERQSLRRDAERFVETVRGNALRSLPPEISSHPRFQAAFQNATVVYGTMLENSPASAPDPKAFEDVLRAQIMADRELVASIKSRMTAQQAAKAKADADKAARDAEIQRIRDQAAAEAVERFKRESAERRAASPPNPLARLDPVPGRATSSDPPPVDLRGMGKAQIREHFRGVVRGG